MDSLPQPLLDAVREGRASVFLGAGASREANFPDAAALASLVATRAGPPHEALLSSFSLDLVAEHLYQEPGYGPAWVRDEVVKIIGSRNAACPAPPSAAHDGLTRHRWRAAFTTNYDSTLEIAYQSSHRAQNLLPIYRDDPLIRRHEPETLRYVKLNGSVDEAQRSSDHKLVLTFADQQEAQARNPGFYQLLRDEAVNGPIIFIGFRFTHPGANTTATSPEFAELKSLLSRMASAGRWHYCVTPLDDTAASKLFVRQLEASRVQVLDMKFGEFINLLDKGVSATAPILGRPPVRIPVGPAVLTLSAEDVDRDRRQFDLLSAEHFSPICSVAETLNGAAVWSSFREDHVIPRDRARDLRSLVDSALATAPELVIFSAPPGWGKTFLLRKIATEYFIRDRRPVFWLNAFGTVHVGQSSRTVTLGTWDAARIDALITQMADVASAGKVDSAAAVPLIIADNCPERVFEVQALASQLSRAGRKFVLVYALRDNEYAHYADDQPLIARMRHLRLTSDSALMSDAEIERLIALCVKHDIGQMRKPSDRDLVATRLYADEVHRAIVLALYVIFDKEHRPFSEIVAGMWKSLKTDLERELVFRTAAFHRLGSLFGPRLATLLSSFSHVKPAELADEYRKCLASGILHERLHADEPSVFTFHSYVAQRLIKASQRGSNEVDSALLSLVRAMTLNERDLELIRQMLRKVAEYEVPFSSPEAPEALFSAAAAATDNDWVVCQQYAKFLVKAEKHEQAFAWAERALHANPDHAPLQHTKGNVLRRWGVRLLDAGDHTAAMEKFQQARECFALSRMRRNADEYGYVTHLEMLDYLISQEHDPRRRAEYTAEGVQLYRQGLRAIPPERINLLLDSRFQNTFDIGGPALDQLLATIDDALDLHAVSEAAIVFYVEHAYTHIDRREGIRILNRAKAAGYSGPLLMIKEAEVRARGGEYSEAARALHVASITAQGLAPEGTWSIRYWKMLVSFALGDYRETRAAMQALADYGFLRNELFPRGHVWKETSRAIPLNNRTFKDAKVYQARVERLQQGNRYGQMSLSDREGNKIYVGFSPRYWKRRDFRPGDQVPVVITILATGLRADDPSGTPFLTSGSDHLYVP